MEINKPLLVVDLFAQASTTAVGAAAVAGLTETFASTVG